MLVYAGLRDVTTTGTAFSLSKLVMMRARLYIKCAFWSAKRSKSSALRIIKETVSSATFTVMAMHLRCFCLINKGLSESTKASD